MQLEVQLGSEQWQGVLQLCVVWGSWRVTHPLIHAQLGANRH